MSGEAYAWSPKAPPAGLEPATYRLEGDPGRTLCSSPAIPGFSAVHGSDLQTITVSLRRGFSVEELVCRQPACRAPIVT